MNHDPPTMIDVPQAWAILFEHVRPLSATRLALREAAYATLAEPVRGDLDQPPFDRSVMDGYAVRAADVASVPVTLRVVGECAAGSMPDRALIPGEAMRINTGAALPPGADAVVRVEDTALDAVVGTVEVRAAASAGSFITARGTFARAGDVVLSAGSLLTPVALAAAAAAGAAEVCVHRRPRVALISTGDELVDPAAYPRGAQIRNTNPYMLEGLIHAAHGETLWLGTARDDREELRARIREGLAAEVLCLTGGVSMGTHDFVPQVLRELGLRVLINKMKIKPGRPVVVGVLPRGTLVFALPGNPISAWTGFELLMRPALAALQGRPAARPATVVMRLNGPLPATRDRRSYFPARAAIDARGLWSAAPLDWHGSGDALGAAAANALIMRPPQSRAARTGDLVQVLLTERV